MSGFRTDMNLLTHRVVVAAMLGWGCLSLSAQQAATPATSGQSVAPAPQPPASPESAQESPATPDGSNPTQNSNGPFTIQQTVRLVVLDMVVTDAKGNVVTNLNRENFHVEEEGQPQEIQNFELAGAHTIDPQLTIDSTADLDKLAPRAPVNKQFKFPSLCLPLFGLNSVERNNRLPSESGVRSSSSV